jgi:uncharacterized membrane protein
MDMEASSAALPTGRDGVALLTGWVLVLLGRLFRVAYRAYTAVLSRLIPRGGHGQHGS